MSNSYFQFKQFRIEQDRCAMKVSTDACIQGAWTPFHYKVQKVLDIGAGTGLLSLMLAQRNKDIHIDAIELDITAAAQASENALASPWSLRIKVIQANVLTYNFSRKYDLIICNPPFFQNSQQSPDEPRNAARHAIHLTYASLAGIFDQWLSPGGYASVLLSAAMLLDWSKILAAKGYVIIQQLNIIPRSGAVCNRIVTIITAGDIMPSNVRDIIIYNNDHTYTEAFISLLQPYYRDL